MLFGPEHVVRYRETDGEEGHDWQGTTVLLLTTTGRNVQIPQTHHPVDRGATGAGPIPTPPAPGRVRSSGWGRPAPRPGHPTSGPVIAARPVVSG